MSEAIPTLEGTRDPQQIFKDAVRIILPEDPNEDEIVAGAVNYRLRDATLGVKLNPKDKQNEGYTRYSILLWGASSWEYTIDPNDDVVRYGIIQDENGRIQRAESEVLSAEDVFNFKQYVDVYMENVRQS